MPKSNKIMPKDNEAFRAFLYSVPMGNYNQIRQTIMERCKINANILKSWQNGVTKIPPLAKPIIEQIANRKIFE